MTSIVIGLGIVFCGGAVIHNVFIWQRVRAKLQGWVAECKFGINFACTICLFLCYMALLTVVTYFN